METQKIHKNQFDGGLNADIEKNILGPSQYIDAFNVTLVGDGKFLALQDVKGTTNVQDITSLPNSYILGAIPSRYNLLASNEKNVNCITIFLYTVISSQPTLKVLCYDTVNDTTYELHSRNVNSSYLDALDVDKTERIIDGFVYAENGNDIIYCTDFYHRPFKIKCEIPSSYSANFLSEKDIDLLKIPALGNIEVESVVTGGSLLSGTYQVAYQLIKPSSQQSTKFSLLTNPIHVYANVGGVIRSSIGLPTNKKILLNITPTENELAYYTHFRLALVEHVSTGVTPTIVGLTSTELISTYLSGNVLQNVPVLSNEQFKSTTIDEIVIDNAAISKVKTMTTRDNRAIFGNVSLFPLNTPVIPSCTGEVLQKVGSGTHQYNTSVDDTFQSKFKGHFRNEVYRYAISYFDDYGNFSTPQKLDLSNILYNTITGATDLKYPSRSYFNSGNYFNVINNLDQLVSLGLRITNINTSPSWARGFVILRAKRKENIKFQTPLIPMVKMYGIGAVGQYPTISVINPNSPTDDNVPSATPMGPSETFLPYNLFFGAPAGPLGNGRVEASFSGGSHPNQKITGELMPFGYIGVNDYQLMFPDKFIYSGNSFSLTGSELVEPADAILCQLHLNKFDTTLIGAPGVINSFLQFNFGQYLNTTTSGSFFALSNNRHYYNYGHGGSKPAIDSNITLNKSFFVDNFGEAQTLGGQSFFDYSKLITGGISHGTRPTTQRALVGQLTKTNINFRGFLPAFSAGLPIFKERLGGPVLYPTMFVTSAFLPSDNPTTNTIFNNINAIEIVNVTEGLSDARYGADGEYHNYIYTGTKVVYSNADRVYIEQNLPLPTGKTVDVWGGDCIVSPHTFKIADTSYNCMVQQKFSTASFPSGTSVTQETYFLNAWERYWKTNSGVVFQPSPNSSVLNLPVGLKGVSQYLTVILESEYNGGVSDVYADDVVYTTPTTNYPVLGAKVESSIKLPKSYDYNININKQNDLKIFAPTDPLLPVYSTYKSRVYYTDLKIYQTDINGFDTIRSGNILDLPETYGSLTKLDIISDKLIAIQERGVSIIPVGERVIETSDLSQLQIRSGEFLAPAVYIDSLRGSQHLKSIKNTGSGLYFMDNINKAICLVNGAGQLGVVSGAGISSKLRSIDELGVTRKQREISSVYDPIRDEYWVGSTKSARMYIYNQGLQKWESALEFPIDGIQSSVFINNKLYILGKEAITNKLVIAEMYTGSMAKFMGQQAQPLVKFIVNPEGDFSKVYNSILINGLAPANGGFEPLVVKTFSPGVIQEAPTQPPTSQRGEGNWKVKILRDINGPTDGNGDFIKRVRGPHAEVTLLWKVGDSIVSPTSAISVLTKYTPSQNIF